MTLKVFSKITGTLAAVTYRLIGLTFILTFKEHGADHRL
jgi:hypothetical protein